MMIECKKCGWGIRALEFAQRGAITVLRPNEVVEGYHASCWYVSKGTTRSDLHRGINHLIERAEW